MRRTIIALLMFWEPLRFASEALAVLPTMMYRGTAAMLELAVHALVAALCAAAGLAVWNASPDARTLATVAIVIAVARAIQSTYWSALPNNIPPGDEPIVASLAVIVGAVAVAVIRVRRRPT